MSDHGMYGLDGSLSSRRCERGHCEQYQNLKVLCSDVAGLSSDLTDPFLTQLPMLTSWDILLLHACFKTFDGVSFGALELFTPSELVGRLLHQRWNGQAKAVGGVSRWTAVELGGWLAVVSAQLLPKSRKFGEFETVHTQDFRWKLQRCNGSIDFHHVGESIPRPKTLTETNDSWRAPEHFILWYQNWI